jgi:hypothetical protein
MYVLWSHIIHRITLNTIQITILLLYHTWWKFVCADFIMICKCYMFGHSTSTLWLQMTTSHHTVQGWGYWRPSSLHPDCVNYGTFSCNPQLIHSGLMYVAVSTWVRRQVCCQNVSFHSLKSTNLIPVAEGQFRIVYVYDICVGSLCPSTTREITEWFS